MVRALIHHTVHIQPQSTSEATPIPVDHVLALVDWYENHPERNHFGENIIVTSTISDQLTAASFIPVSHNLLHNVPFLRLHTVFIMEKIIS